MDNRPETYNESLNWWDFYKIFTYSFAEDPLSQREKRRDITGAGTSQPDVVPDVRQDGSTLGGGRGVVRLRDSNDFIDLSSVTNRTNRYKEYERLRNVPEIEMAMTVFADEACIGENTKIATPFFGMVPIKWLAANKKDERFLVYCWDFKKNDYTLGWAYNPRKVKTAPTIKVKLDNGDFFIATPDHRVLLRNGEWIMAGQLKKEDDLMPFYHLPADRYFNEENRTYHKKIKHKQFPRIFTFKDGWKNERQFIDEWKSKKPSSEQLQTVYQANRLLAQGMPVREVAKYIKREWNTIQAWIHKEGFTLKEMRRLGRKEDLRYIIGIEPYKEMDVYDLSVEEHENFCGESVIFHNCQKGEGGHVLKLTIDNDEVRKELEFLLFHKGMLNVDRKIWTWAKKLFTFGDVFLELIINPESPKDGILKVQELPADSMYRIETTKGKLLEYQQGKEGPDYIALTRSPVTQATEADLQQTTAIRFAPNQVVHFRIGDDRKTFYPYGVSLIEPARGPAHQLRLMEDAMVVYRLSRAPERRVFYIDVGQMPSYKAEALINRLKDQFRKKKVSTTRGGGVGASAVEERWHAPAADEDYWLPIRPNANTRIETLPGAQNLGEIDDALYFRNKLFTALNFPKAYWSSEDPQATRITLSAQDVKFARMIERLQAHIEDGLMELCERHLILRGFPEETFEDLSIKMTPPSDWRELSRAEIITNRLNHASNLKSAMLLSDFDILTKWMTYTEEEAREMLARLKIQKLEDLKLQIIGQNPQLLGVGLPGDDQQPEIGTEPGGPNPMLSPPGAVGAPPGAAAPPPPAGGVAMGAEQKPAEQKPSTGKKSLLPMPTPEDIKKYDLEIQDYDAELDHEEIII